MTIGLYRLNNHALKGNTMNTFLVVIAILGSTLIWLAAAWMDKKHNWKLIDWFSGNTSNPFLSEKAEHTRIIHRKDQQIAELIESVQVLEKIVTEPAYELNKKINQL